jgi:hypothetical protein
MSTKYHVRASAISNVHGLLLLLLLLPGQPPLVWESCPPSIWQVQQHPKLLTRGTEVPHWLLLLLLLLLQLLQVLC